MTADLAAWLTAVWDERQRVFEYPPDSVEDSGSARGPGWGKIGGDSCEVCDSYQFSGYESVVEDAWYEHMEQYHQRSEVLARIAADRKILELHGPRDTHYGRQCEYCASLCHSRSGLGCDEPDAPWPCDTVRLLASPYADREGFRSEWLVERQGVER